MKPGEFARSPLGLDIAREGWCAFSRIDRNKPRFEQLAALRRAVDSFGGAYPRGIALRRFDDEAVRQVLGREAVYVARIDTLLGSEPRDGWPQSGQGAVDQHGFDALAALSRANGLRSDWRGLARGKDIAGYRGEVERRAQALGWSAEEYAARPSTGEEVPAGRILHFAHTPRGSVLALALVGEAGEATAGGIADAGSAATVLAMLEALAEQNLPVRVDAWTAFQAVPIDRPSLPGRSTPPRLAADPRTPAVAEALRHKLLADSLALAARGVEGHGPNLIVDFASLSGALLATGGRLTLLPRPAPSSLDLAVDPDGQLPRDDGVLAWGMELLRRWLAEKPDTLTRAARRRR